MLLLSSCSSKIKKKNVNDDLVLRQRAFVEELYMPLLTPWSNTSDLGACKRESDWLYLNFNEVRKKTTLNYIQSLNLQYQLNVLWNQKKPYISSDSTNLYSQRLLPSDRLSLLEQALERVNGGISFWSLPASQYPIWLIDWDAILPQARLDFLSNLLSLPEIKDVIPVIISRCSSSFSIKSILNLRPDLLSFSNIIGVEVMTIFALTSEKEDGVFTHSLGAYFDVKADIYWVLPKEKKASLKKDQIQMDDTRFKAKYF